MEDSNSYFRAVVNDAVDDILEKGTAYCFQKEQADAITSILNEQYGIKDLHISVTDGIFYISKYKESVEVDNV